MIAKSLHERTTFKIMLKGLKIKGIKLNEKGLIQETAYITRTAWAVFKYCGTKTATLSLSTRS